MSAANEAIALETVLWTVAREVAKGNASEDLADAWDAYEEACEANDV